MPSNPTPPSASADYLWFLNTLVRVRVSATTGSDGMCVIEHRVLQGDSPPLHIHRNEDEIFHVLEGDVRLRVGDREMRVGAGAILLAPKGIPHTYRVESSAGGRFLSVTRGGDFERFVRAVARPAERPDLPPQAGPPSPEARAQLAALAAQHGIELCGPPMA